jgi:hypothetical protein
VGIVQSTAAIREGAPREERDPGSAPGKFERFQAAEYLRRCRRRLGSSALGLTCVDRLATSFGNERMTHYVVLRRFASFGEIHPPPLRSPIRVFSVVSNEFVLQHYRLPYISPFKDPS